VCGSILFCGALTIHIALSGLQTALLRPATWEATSEETGVSAETVADMVTLDSLIARLPTVVTGTVGDPTRFMSSAERKQLETLLREAAMSTWRDTLAAIPVHIQTPSRPIRVVVKLEPARTYLVERIEAHAGPTFSMLFGSTLRSGVRSVIPDDYEIESIAAALTERLKPLCEAWPGIRTAGIASLSVGIVAFFLMIVGAMNRTRFLMALLSSIAVSGLLLSLSTKGALSALIALKHPVAPSLLDPLTRILAADLRFPGNALLGASLLLSGSLFALMILKRKRGVTPPPP